MEASLFLLFRWSPIETLIAKFCLNVSRKLFKTIIHDRLGNLEHFVFAIRGISAGQLSHASCQSHKRVDSTLFCCILVLCKCSFSQNFVTEFLKYCSWASETSFEIVLIMQRCRTTETVVHKPFTCPNKVAWFVGHLTRL